MDKKTVEKMSGRITEVTVHIHRNIWTKNPQGSFEIGFGETRSVAPDVDADVVYREMYSGIMGKIDAAIAKFELHDTPTTIKDAPPPIKDAPQPEPQQVVPSPETETRTALDEAGNELEKFYVATVEILFAKSGNKYGRVKGGKWTDKGVAVWSDILAQPPLEWDLDTLDVGEYKVPEGVSALVKMGVYKGKPSPDSVVGWA